MGAEYQGEGEALRKWGFSRQNGVQRMLFNISRHMYVLSKDTFGLLGPRVERGSSGLLTLSNVVPPPDTASSTAAERSDDRFVHLQRIITTRRRTNPATGIYLRSTYQNGRCAFSHLEVSMHRVTTPPQIDSLVTLINLK
jgi:hypothetical protein